MTSAVVLGELPQLAVPNPLLDPGSAGYGQTFQAVALGVLGTIATPGQEDFYAITGHAGQVLSFEVTSVDNTLNPRPFPPELIVLDGTGHVLGYNVHNFESPDPMLLDLTLPSDGTYFVGVDAYGRQATGNYRLLMYGLSAVSSGAPRGNGVTVYGSGGNDTLAGSSGDDTFIYQPGAVGHVTIQASSGADVLDLRSAPLVTYTLTGDTTLGTLTVLTQQGATALSLTSVNPANATIQAGKADTFTVAAVDTNSNSVAGYRSTITLASSDPSAVFADAATGTVLTGATYTFTAADSGTHTFTVTFTKAGNPSITASDAVNNLSGSMNLTVQPAAASNLTASAGSSQTATVGASFSTSLQVSVTDTYGNPVSGVSVTFTAPSSGASGSFAGTGNSATAITNAQGVATAPVLTANTKAGSFSVTASATGVSGTVSFSLSNTPSAPAQLAFGQQPTTALAKTTISPAVTLRSP